MNKILFLMLLALLQHAVHAQNVGIGTNNPIRAKLEVHDVVVQTPEGTKTLQVVKQ